MWCLILSSVLFIIYFKISLVCSQNEHLMLSLKCQSQTDSCSSCINTHENCSWCYDLGFKSERCDIRINLIEAQCKHMSKVQKSIVETILNNKFQDVINSTSSAVQIKPQKIKMQLRPGERKTIKLKYRVAKNYPLDLYYLIDSTYTMKDDIEMLVALGDDISHHITNLTKYFRFGYGSFSDKVLLPFYKTDEEHLENPCKDQYTTCAPGYNFKHEYNFSSDVKSFIDTVNSTLITANLDNAEGGLDALMQIITCYERIGWLKESRKLILVLTNSLLHIAGDGKLAGVITKNDENCHLDNNGKYSQSNMQDYPSLDQIYNKLKFKKINVIFAVTKNVINYYKKFHNVIRDYTYVTELHSDSSNILNVIKQGYIDAVSSVHFQDNAQYPLNLTYFSTCNKGIMKNINHCSNIKEGDTYEFNINFFFENCPSDRNLLKQTIIIDEKNLPSEKLIVDFNMLCECDCKKSENETRSFCNNNGVIKCGICECDPGWSGNDCSCNLSNFENNRKLENNCRKITKNSTSAMCHSRGECECGKCICEPSYSGKYCECEKCNEIDGKQCGGPMRGICSCGKCLCNQDYNGTNCMCPISTDNCVAPGDTRLCADRGKCECGKCKCDTDLVFYSGEFCEKCATCEGLCSLYRECVECSIVGNCLGVECRYKAGFYSIQFVDSLDSERLCSINVNDLECKYWQYTYEFNRNHIIELKIASNCSTTFKGQIGFYFIFGAIVLFGLLVLLVYKIKITYEDKREYAAHMKNVLEVQYKELNPLYVTPFRQYEVPRMKDE